MDQKEDLLSNELYDLQKYFSFPDWLYALLNDEIAFENCSLSEYTSPSMLNAPQNRESSFVALLKAVVDDFHLLSVKCIIPFR